MKRDRKTILGLVALGRITPYQAERLLVACGESRDGWWLVAVVALGLLALASMHPGLPTLGHSLHAWLSGGVWHRALALMARCNGGRQ
jgi:hypothetical protein